MAYGFLVARVIPPCIDPLDRYDHVRQGGCCANRVAVCEEHDIFTDVFDGVEYRNTVRDACRVVGRQDPKP